MDPGPQAGEEAPTDRDTRCTTLVTDILSWSRVTGREVSAGQGAPETAGRPAQTSPQTCEGAQRRPQNTLLSTFNLW